MRKRNPKMIYDVCRRGCGKRLASMAKSLSGNKEMEQKYRFICKDCITKDENEEIQNKVFDSMMGKLIGF